MIAALFVLKLAAGITLMWWLMPRQEVTDGFFRIQMRVLLGLCVLAALLFSVEAEPSASSVAAAPSDRQTESAVSETQPSTLSAAAQQRIRNLSIVACVVSYLGSVVWALGRRLPGNLCIFVLLLTCSTMLLLSSWQSSGKHLPLQLLADVSSAGVVGGMLTGMLLGHWYLTTPTMSIRPLLWFNVAILVAAALRLTASCWALLEFGMVAEMTQRIWLGMRWAGGIVTPAVTTLMVWRIMKHRNTQSATGVLFAGLILAFMGEMTAILLERATSVPY
ncbi:MAG: hypothetical protein NXI04_04635 [Planctomycetaceae bacterium]|nr:hypothetical protein [Planctomycetaceae bacterium]